LAELEREIFGPVLHVLRYSRKDLDRLLEDINRTGYALTFGLHSRISDNIAGIRTKVAAGNIYVNRNIIGAVVGVQPFGGNCLSGTGPKAGGPLYLRRLGLVSDQQVRYAPSPTDPALRDLQHWLSKRRNLAVGSESGDWETSLADLTASMAHQKISTEEVELPGPVGEQNLYALRPRGKVLLFPETEAGLCCQLAAVFATGNVAVIAEPCPVSSRLDALPQSLSNPIPRSPDGPRTALTGPP
jgi:RHH-type transcriptional regulator, proline utilization regulon repressor / proline dehydrogenase / delta 1-pyrroline-5-carboxylate dehydrogenase